MARVLVVEDDDQVAALYGEWLAEAGHESERVISAYEGCLRINQTSYDLVIMDLLLRGTNGIVAGLALRGLGYQGPIVVITGGADQLDQTLYDRVGFSEKVIKPILHGRDLLAEIEPHLPLIAQKG